jgi:hypothetical protein
MHITIVCFAIPAFSTYTTMDENDNQKYAFAMDFILLYCNKDEMGGTCGIEGGKQEVHTNV